MFRDMRRKNQLLPQEEAEAILRQGTSGVLSLLGDGGYPYGVPLSYVYHNGKLYFHCAKAGHKLDAIRREGKCSFCVIGQDQVVAEKYTTLFRSVIAFGQVRVLEDDGEKRAALEALGERFNPGQPESLEKEIACHLEQRVRAGAGDRAPHRQGSQGAAEQEGWPMSGASPLKDFARYTSLNVLGMIALSCYILADTFFVSLGLGADGLAALNLAIPIYNFIHGSGLMIGMGGGTRYSILQSQGNRREANKVFTHVLYLAAVLAAFFVAVGLLFAGDIVRLFGGAGNVFTMARTYLRVILLFCPRLFDEQRAAVLCAQRRRAPTLHGCHDWGQPLQRGAGLGVHLPLRHGDFRRGVRHGPGTHHQHGHPLPPLLPAEEQLPPGGLQAPGPHAGAHPLQRGALPGDGGLLGDRHHRLQRPHYGPGGQHRRGGLRGDCQPILGGHRHLHGDCPGHPAHPQPQLRRRG